MIDINQLGHSTPLTITRLRALHFFLISTERSSLIINISPIDHGNVEIRCKWLHSDSSDYYAVTLVSSDAVFLLSHHRAGGKKGSWVRGTDGTLSALVTRIVYTLKEIHAFWSRIKGIAESISSARHCKKAQDMAHLR